MAQSVSLWGATYSDVPALDVPKTGGGTARFTDTTPTTAIESDVASGKVFIKADGSLATGTGSGGAFIVTLSWDSTEELWMPDKTITALQDAYENDEEIIFVCDDGRPVGWFYDDDYVFVYVVFSGGNNELIQTYYIFTTQGVEEGTVDRTIVPVFESPSVTYTPTESQQTQTITYNPNDGYNGIEEVSVTVNAISSTYVGTGITRRSSTDLTVSGATVTVPSGYYSSNASKAVASGTAGTPTATKGTVSNHSISVTPSVTNTAGYISGGTINGTAVTVSASELASGNKAITQNGTGIDVVGYSTVSVDVPSSGGVTVTDEANATGTTCVITSGGSPTPSGIPLNTELIDFTKLTEDYAINSSGEAVATQWYCVSDYTAVDPSMTFSYTGCRWYYIGVYDSSKEVLRTIYIYNDGTVDPDNTNLANGTLSGSELTGASYVRITGVAVQSQYRLSLIRTA